MSVAEADDAYFRAVEEEFQRRRGAPMLLSPRDWALIGEWRKADVPLRIVLQGMANAFESFARRGPGARRINSLSYCRQEILGLHQVYLGLAAVEAGRPEADGGARDAVRSVSRYLGRLARRVREAMAYCSEARLDRLVAALALTASELKRARRESKSVPLAPQAIEALLARLDGNLIEAARASLPAAEVEEAESRADRHLADARARMSAAAYAATRGSFLARWLRERCRIPRLTLFE